MLRALWGHCTAQNDDQLVIYLPDHALVKSIKSSNDVVEWLHKTVQLQLHSLVAVLNHPIPRKALLTLFLAALVMFLATSYDTSGLPQSRSNMG